MVPVRVFQGTAFDFKPFGSTPVPGRTVVDMLAWLHGLTDIEQ
jgi:hypothetical protein